MVKCPNISNESNMLTDIFLKCLLQMGLSYCWGFLWAIVESLPYKIKHFESTAVVLWCYINKTELNQIN